MRKFYVYVDKRGSYPHTVFYVGKGHGIRFRTVMRRCNPHWMAVVKKSHGFSREIVFRGSEQECFEKERELIKTYGRSNLVNMTDGGEGVSGYKRTTRRRFSEETKRKISLANKGRKHSAQSRKNMSLAHIGGRGMVGKHSDEAKLKISKLKLGNKYMLGKKHSEESKIKMSMSHKARFLAANKPLNK